jgi:hypothetical protein
MKTKRYERKYKEDLSFSRRRIWDMMPFSLFYFEDEGKTFVRIIDTSLPDYKISPSLFFLHDAVSI